MYAFKKSRQAAITTTITTIDEAKQGKKNAFMQRVQKKKHKCPLCGETPLLLRTAHNANGSKQYAKYAAC